MPAGRPKGAKSLATIEYLTLYDGLVAEYGCPVEALFKLALGRYKPAIRLRAASALVNKRYPQQIAVKPDTGDQSELTFTWSTTEPIDADRDTLPTEAARLEAPRSN